MNPFKLLSDVEILEIAEDYLVWNVYSSFEEAFNPKHFPFFSRRRARKLLEWIEDHDISSFIFIAVGRVTSTEYQYYQYKWLRHLIQEIEND